MTKQDESAAQSNAIYQPPAVETAPNHSAFSVDEWRYIAKVFAYWVVGASVFAGIALTLQTVYALRAYAAGYRSGGIVAISALRQVAPAVVMFAVCTTLALAIERRSEKALPPPTRIDWYGWVVAWLYVALPIASGIIVVTSFVTTTIAFDGLVAEFWLSIRRLLTLEDFLFGVVVLSNLAVLQFVTAPILMRLLSRRPGWLLLKYFVLWLICATIAIFIGNILGTLQVVLE